MFDRYVAATEPSWTRRALIFASIFLHGSAAIALAIYSIFHVEEIAPPAVSLTFFSAPPPPPPPPPPAHKKSTTTVEKKIVPTNIVQPTKVVIVQPKQEEKKDDDKDDGEEGGVEGGVKGGVQGGTVGGVIGGTIGGTGTDTNAKPGPAKMVAAFTLMAQQLSHPDPHLSEEFKSAHPHENVKGMYKVCIGTDGHISDVTPMTPIPGMDKIIIDQIRAGWTYKPQPVPVCTASVIMFKIP